MSTSSIEWTEQTWNPVSGCTRASPGCDHCYAVTMTHRLESMGQAEKYGGLTVLNAKGDRHFNGKVRTHDDALTIPLKRRKPTTWFVNSMSDLFHRDVPFAFVDKVFAVMALCPQHTFQILTKRPERMAEYLTCERGKAIDWAISHDGPSVSTPLRCYDAVLWEVDKLRDDGYGLAKNGALIGVGWPLPNVWLGTSVEDHQRADERIPHLLRCPAAVRFLSAEPLLGPVDLMAIQTGQTWPGKREPSKLNALLGFTYSRREPFVLNGITEDRGETNCIDLPDVAAIDWVIVGGESGPGARPCDTSWVRSIVRQCRDAGVATFVKQMGSVPVTTLGGQNTPDGTKAFPMRLKDKKGGDPAEWPEDLRIREMPTIREAAHA